MGGSGADLTVVQTAAYVNGNNYFQLDWRLTNNGGGQTYLKFYHAADIYFANDDYGIGYYNAGTGSVGGFNQARDWFMIFTPLIRASHYKEAGFGTIWNDISAAADFNDTIDATYLDNGAGLQWNVCLEGGQTTSISDLWSFGESEAEVIPTVVAPPGGGVTPGAAGPVDVWAKDSPEDDGSVPSTRLNAAWWTSPDIIVRNQADDSKQHQNPVQGQTNYVYVQVRNAGMGAAQDVRVHLYWANPALGLFWPNSWNDLGSTTVTVPAGGTVWTAPVQWNPPGTGHFCLLVRLESNQDPIRAEGDAPGDNNIAQRNVHVMGLSQTVAGSSVGSSTVDVVAVGPPGAEDKQVDIVVQYPNKPAGLGLGLTMPSDLFQRWQDAGGTVTGGEIVGGRIILNGANEAVISRIPLAPLQEAHLGLEFNGPTETPFAVGVVERVDGQDVGGNVYVYEGLIATPTPAGPVLPALGQSEWLLVALALCCLCLVGLGLLMFLLFLFRRRR